MAKHEEYSENSQFNEDVKEIEELSKKCYQKFQEFKEKYPLDKGYYWNISIQGNIRCVYVPPNIAYRI